MTQLYEIKVKLSENRKRNLSWAFHQRDTIVLRLASNALSGSDTLYVPSNFVKRLNKNRKLNKGMDIKLAKTNIRKQVGGSLLTSILSMGRSLQKQITGRQVGGFLIPQDKINQLIVHKYLLTNNQKRDILNALQTGSGVRIQPTRTQLGNGLGTILATIGIPIAMELVKKITGRGAPRLGRSTNGKQDVHGAPRLGMYQPPPPFIGTLEQMRGGGEKKKKNSGKKPATRSQFTVEQHTYLYLPI